MDLGKVSQTICTLLGDKAIKRVIFVKEATEPDYIKKGKFLILPESILTGRSADEVIATAVSEALRIRTGVKRKVESKISDSSSIKQTILETLSVAVTDLEASNMYPGYLSVIRPARERQFLALEAVGTKLGLWAAYVLGISSGAAKLPSLKLIEPLLGGSVLRETLDILNNYNPPSYSRLVSSVDRLAQLLGDNEEPESGVGEDSDRNDDRTEDSSDRQTKSQNENKGQEKEEQEEKQEENKEQDEESGGNQENEELEEDQWDEELDEKTRDPVIAIVNPFSDPENDALYACIDLTDSYIRASTRPHWETIEVYSPHGNGSGAVRISTAPPTCIEVQKQIENNVYSTVRRYVKSPQMVTKRRLERGNRLDRSVWRAATGQRTVFKRKKYDLGLSVSVCLCVDMSLSMVYHKNPRGTDIYGLSHYASSQLVATAIARGLNRAGIPTAVVGFTSCLGTTVSFPWLYRNQPICLYEILPYSPVKSDLGMFIGTQHAGENYDGESLMAIFEKWVRPRPEEYKAMIVLSDGDPAGPMVSSRDLNWNGSSNKTYSVDEELHKSHDKMFDFLKASLHGSLDSLRQLGIDPLGIGLYNNKSVKEFYTNYLILGSDASLETEIPKAITDYLIKEVICS